MGCRDAPYKLNSLSLAARRPAQLEADDARLVALARDGAQAFAKVYRRHMFTAHSP